MISFLYRGYIFETFHLSGNVPEMKGEYIKCASGLTEWQTKVNWIYKDNWRSQQIIALKKLSLL